MEKINKFLDEILQDRIAIETDYVLGLNLEIHLNKLKTNISNLNNLADTVCKTDDHEKLLNSIKSVTYDFYRIRDKVLDKINNA